MPSRDDRLIELLSQYRQPLFGFIFTMVHRIADAEDVFQQTSMVLWKKFDQFEEGTDFIAWACSIARFQAIDFLRARQRDRLCFSESMMTELEACQHEPSEALSELAEALEGCKKKLSESDQHTIDTCYAPGIKIKEAAVSLGRNVGSVYTSLNRIRQSLAACIQRRLSQEIDK